MKVNPRIFPKGYPKSIRDTVPSKTGKEKRQPMRREAQPIFLQVTSLHAARQKDWVPALAAITVATTILRRAAIL